MHFLLYDEIYPFHKKNFQWQEEYLRLQTEYDICHRRIFLCERNRIFLVTGNLFPVTGIKKTSCVTIMKERIFTVTRNEYPVTGRTMNTRIWFFVSNVQMGRGHQYIDPLTVYFCPVLFLVTTLCWLLSWWWRDFSRCFGRNYLLEN